MSFRTDDVLWAWYFLLTVSSLKVFNLASNINMSIADYLVAKEVIPLELDSLDRLSYLSLKHIYIVNINLSIKDMTHLKVSFENAWFQNLDVSNNSMTEFLTPGEKFYDVDCYNKYCFQPRL